MRPRSRGDLLLYWTSWAAVVFPLVLLAILFGAVLVGGAGRLSLTFLTGYPSRHPEQAGIWPAAVGTVWLVVTTVALALPLGVGAAIYLEEYDRTSRWRDLLEVNIANLAGVPSIVYGLLGLGLFVRGLGLGQSVLAGAATMALLVLPIVIMASREALRTVPDSAREGALALGASRWAMVWQVVLPQAGAGILTGLILAVARIIGETAPLVVVGAIAYLTFTPNGLDSPFTVLPIQIYNWLSRPQRAFQDDAAAGILILLAVTIVLNGVAVLLRQRFEQRGGRS